MVITVTMFEIHMRFSFQLISLWFEFVGHRGAPVQFPEHTKESYTAALEMGAGIVECDVAVTKDGELVCRHAQCDLHTSTNILATGLAAKCTKNWDETDKSPKCCTSDITLAEFKTLEGKMDAADSAATTVAGYMKGTAAWRTDLYSPGTLMTHTDSIKLIKAWGRKATPELKKYTKGDGMPEYDAIRKKIVQEYKDNSFPASDVFLQSFEIADIEYWIANEADFGKQAVYLDNAYCDGTSGTQQAPAGMDPEATRGCKEPAFNDALATAGDEKSPFMLDDGFATLKSKGINYIAPPMQMLIKKDGTGFAKSEYATAAKAAGLKIITWTLERSGPLGSGGGWYYGTVNSNVNNDGDMLEVLHVLNKDVGIEGIFSDWAATVTFYANCLGVGLGSKSNAASTDISPVDNTSSSFVFAPNTVLTGLLAISAALIALH